MSAAFSTAADIEENRTNGLKRQGPISISCQLKLKLICCFRYGKIERKETVSLRSGLASFGVRLHSQGYRGTEICNAIHSTHLLSYSSCPNAASGRDKSWKLLRRMSSAVLRTNP